MKMPWMKEPTFVVPHPPMITDEEVLARREAWEAQLRDRAERTARIPENLVGYRLSRGCTCGAEAEALKTMGSRNGLGSMGIRHEDACEMLRGLFAQVIEG